MNIDDAKSANYPAMETETRPTALKNELGWLQEWEQAQWQQRLRYQPQSLGEGAGAGERDARAKTPAGRVPTGVERQQDPASPRAGLDAKPVAGAGASRETVVTARPVLEHPLAAPLTAARSGHSQPLSTFAGGMESRFTAWLAYARPVWPLRYAHTVLGAGGVRVWVRDFSLNRGEGRKLLDDLRAHFAKLGCRLASVSLNGEVIWQPAADVPSIDEQESNITQRY